MTTLEKFSVSASKGLILKVLAALLGLGGVAGGYRALAAQPVTHADIEAKIAKSEAKQASATDAKLRQAAEDRAKALDKLNKSVDLLSRKVGDVAEDVSYIRGQVDAQRKDK